MGPIVAFVARRLLLLVPILLGASVVVFALVHLAPGDEATVLLGPLATPQARDELRRHLGLDQPLPFQYAIWLWNSLHLDFGMSINKHQSVADLIIEALKNTLILASASAILAIVVGFALGTLAATRQFTRTDRIAMGVAVLLAAIPSYWLGIMLVVLFSSLLEVSRLDFVLALRSSGLPERAILRRHVLRNALPPIVNMIGLQVGYLLSGVIFVEVVFSWPGIGRLVFEAIGQRDLPVILGAVMVVSVTFVLINLAVDVIHLVLDPRLRAEVA